MAEGLPILPDFVADDTEANPGPLEALAEARRRGVPGIVEFEARLGDLSLAPDVVVVALMLSYRAEQAWDRFMAVVQSMRPALAGHPFVRQQRAFALNRGGRGADAEQILLQLLGEEGPSPETNGILGRVYKDRFVAAHEAGDNDASARWLQQAIDTYLGGHDADPTDPYPGVNALSLMEFTFPKPPRRDALLREVAAATEARRTAEGGRYWDHATAWELAILTGDQPTAEAALTNAMVSVEEPWQAHSTMYNTRMVQAAWVARGVAANAWVADLAGRLESMLPPGSPPAGPSAPDVPGGQGGPGEPGGQGGGPQSDPGAQPPGGTEGVTTEGPPTERMPTEGTATEGPPTERMPTEGTTTEGPPTERMPTEGTATEGPPTERMPTEGTTAEGTTTEGTTTEGTTVTPPKPRGVRRVLKWLKRLLVTTTVVAVVALAVGVGLLAFGPENFENDIEDALGLRDGFLDDNLPSFLVDDDEPAATDTTVPPATTIPPATTLAPATTVAPATTLAPATTVVPTTTRVPPTSTTTPPGECERTEGTEPRPPTDNGVTFTQVDDRVRVFVNDEEVRCFGIIRFNHPPAELPLALSPGDIVRIEAEQGPGTARLVGALMIDGEVFRAWDEDPGSVPPGVFFEDEVTISLAPPEE